MSQEIKLTGSCAACHQLLGRGVMVRFAECCYNPEGDSSEDFEWQSMMLCIPCCEQFKNPTVIFKKDLGWFLTEGAKDEG